MSEKGGADSGRQELMAIDDIQSRIYAIHGVQVMLDSDLAECYGVEVGRLNEQVKRNIERFPETFCFQFTDRNTHSVVVLKDCLRDTLLPKLISGQMRIEDAERFLRERGIVLTS